MRGLHYVDLCASKANCSNHSWDEAPSVEDCEDHQRGGFIPTIPDECLLSSVVTARLRELLRVLIKNESFQGYVSSLTVRHF